MRILPACMWQPRSRGHSAGSNPPPDKLPQSFFIPRLQPPPHTIVHVNPTYSVTLFAAARLPISARSAYSILTMPDPSKVFRNALPAHRRTVLDSSPNSLTALVTQGLVWRFLFLRGAFDATVLILQSMRDLTIRYRLTKVGFMSQFEGEWAVLPLVCKRRSGVCRLAPPRDRYLSANECVVLNWQRIRSRYTPPPGLRQYVSGIVEKTIRTVMEDLETEAQRIRELRKRRRKEKLKKRRSRRWGWR